MAISDCYCYRSYRQINWQMYPPVEASSGQEWQFQISIVTGHIGRSTGRSTPTPWQRHLVAKNGNFILLLLKVIQADQLADVPPAVEASNGQKWQFQIAIVTGHIGRLTTPTERLSVGPISYCYRSYRQASSGQEWQFQIDYCYRSHRQINWQMYPYPKQRHLVAKNGNFRLLLLQVIQADQLADLPPSSRGIQWTKNGNFRLLLLQVIQDNKINYTELPPPEASSGQEGIQWPRQNGNFMAILIVIVTGHIGRSTGRSTHTSRGIQLPRMAISDCYCYRSYRQIN